MSYVGSSSSTLSFQIDQIFFFPFKYLLSVRDAHTEILGPVGIKMMN